MNHVNLEDLNLKKWGQIYKIGLEHFNHSSYGKALQIFNHLFNCAHNIQQKNKVWNPIFQCYRNLRYDSLKIVEKLQQLFQRSNDNLQIALTIAEHFVALSIVERAKPWFKKSIEIDPNFTFAYFRLSDLFQEEGKVEDNILLLEKCRLKNPNDPQVLLKLSKVYDLIKSMQKSAQCYQKLIKIDPLKGQYYYGYIQRDMHCKGDYHSAKCRKYLEQGAKLLKKMDHQYYYLLGQILFTEGTFVDAIKAFKKSIALKSDNFDCYLDLSQAYIYTGQVEKAIQNLQNFVKMNPKCSDAWNHLAIYYYQHYGFIRFTSVIKELQIKFNNMFLSSIGMFYIHSGQIQRATKYFQQWRKINKKESFNFFIYKNLYKCYASVGNWEKATYFLVLKKEIKEITFGETVELAQTYLKINKIQCCKAIIQQMEQKLFNFELQLSDIVSLLGLMLRANQVERCMQIYDSYLVMSKQTLSLENKIELQMTLIECHYKLNQVLTAFEQYEQLLKIMRAKQSFGFTLLLKFMNIQIQLFRYEDLDYYFKIFAAKIEKSKAEGEVLYKIFFAQDCLRIQKYILQWKEQSNKNTTSK